MKKAFFTFFVLFFSLAAAVCQSSKRPKLGVALSGGGAKGLAHIGVIEAMQKAGLQPDYITGTSMGSLVGALWAMGYTSEQMVEVVDTLNWDAILSNSIPFREIAIEEKEFYGRFIAEFPFDGKKLNLPGGLLEGQKLGELFSSLTRSVHGVADFNELPIPYMAIAADITTGEQVEITTGLLPEAMRASMAIPGVFSPVERGDQVLVDGGIVRNFPVQNVIDMGADIVIGVYVSSDLSARVAVTSMVDVIAESAFIAGTKDSREQKELADYFIRPDLSGFTSASFSASDSIVERGRQAGNENFGLFKNLADSLNSFGEAREVPPVDLPGSYNIKVIDINGADTYLPTNIARKFKISDDELISISDIENRIDLLYGKRRYKSIYYSIHPAESGDTLRITLKEAPKGDVKLNARYDSENLAGININFTLRNFLLRQSRTIVEADIAQNPGIDASILRYIGSNFNSAFALGLSVSTTDIPLYDDDFVAAKFRNVYQRYYLRYLTTTSQKYSIGADLFTELARYKPKVGSLGDTTINKVTNTNFGVRTFFVLNTLNRRYYATKGSEVLVEYNFHFAKSATVDFSVPPPTAIPQLNDLMNLRIDWKYQGRIIGDKLAWFARNTVWISNLPTDTPYLIDYSYIGGFVPRFTKSYEYWGADINEFPVNNYFYSKLGLQWNPVGQLFLIGGVNYIDVEYPKAFFESDPDINLLNGQKRSFGYGAGIAYLTPIGPVQVNVAKDINRNSAVATLILGYYF